MQSVSPRLSAALRTILAACALVGGGILLGIAASIRTTGATLSESNFIVSPLYPAVAGILFIVVAGMARVLPIAGLLASSSLSLALSTGLALLVLPTGKSVEIRINESHIVSNAAKETEHIYYEENIGDDHFLRAAYSEDQELGTRFAPGSVATDKHSPEFEVHYTIGRDGNRLIQDKRPRIVFLGCSFTFGSAVEDDETFSSLVANALPRYRVDNDGNSGWGTGQALIMCQRELRREDPPVAMIYTFISNHLGRNYLRKSWHGRLYPAGKYPLFDVVDGKLTYVGTKTHSEALEPDNDATTLKEYEITCALIQRMHDLCREKNVRFAFVVVSEIGRDLSGPILEYLRSHEIPILDFRQVSQAIYQKNYHPKPEWHRAVAQAFLSNEPLRSLP